MLGNFYTMQMKIKFKKKCNQTEKYNIVQNLKIKELLNWSKMYIRNICLCVENIRNLRSSFICNRNIRMEVTSFWSPTCCLMVWKWSNLILYSVTFLSLYNFIILTILKGNSKYKHKSEMSSLGNSLKMQQKNRPYKRIQQVGEKNVHFKIVQGNFPEKRA